MFVCVRHRATRLCCCSPSERPGEGRCGKLWWRPVWCGLDWGLRCGSGLRSGRLVFFGPSREFQGSPASASSLLAGWVLHTWNRKKEKKITVNQRRQVDVLDDRSPSSPGMVS